MANLTTPGRERLLDTLEEFCSLSIFRNESYLEQVSFEWIGKFSNITVEPDGKKYDRREDIIQNHPELYFGFRITPSFEKGNVLSNSKEGEDRYRAKILIRKVFLRRDNCNLKDIISSYNSGEDNQMINEALRYCFGGRSGIRWGLSSNNTPAISDVQGLRLEGISSVDDFATVGLTESQLFDLFLYGGEIHSDNQDKVALFNAYTDQIGEYVEVVIDVYMMILFRLSRHIFIPLLKS